MLFFIISWTFFTPCFAMSAFYPLDYTLLLSKSLLHCLCVRRTDFVAKYSSIIFTCCCVVNRPVGSILVSKEFHRSAVYTTWETWKKIVKHNFEMKKKIGRFFGPPYVLDEIESKTMYKDKIGD